MQKSREITFLKRYKDFCYFTEEEFMEIEKYTYLRSYKKGQVLFDLGDERNRMYLLKSGVVKIEKIDFTGEFEYIDFLNQGTLFPKIGFLFDEDYYFSAVAYTDIEVYYLPKEIYEKLIQHNASQLMNYIRSQSDCMKRQMLKNQKGIANNAIHRLSFSLAVILEDFGTISYEGGYEVGFPITINDLSKLAGITRETASSIIKQLECQGRINYYKKRLVFMDTNYFMEYLND
ncbi:Crp/Fnr family transcriptional regulator [Vagococcus xieshaowenii]|uniref:Crp/Fnr family transcriptional regulator n=1 Tax=Vagococcus xieshaowenii TaxID=2562451 RepID=A0AAJ5EG52_9ENTE|nr:Crp/Fnr family transcriptional regulator [Vagococcus xieshaowenii]QCA28182.1 Crp/Fnr family transcriptional regulator [Vagococcus xieshaowenii]TFZ42535.1 Crp/Fnr family transcriptional regulator [Vagococcus xieshaowenii]